MNTEQQTIKENMTQMFLSDVLETRVAAWYLARSQGMSDFDVCCFVWNVIGENLMDSMLSMNFIDFDLFRLDNYYSLGRGFTQGCDKTFSEFDDIGKEERKSIKHQFEILKPLIEKL